MIVMEHCILKKQKQPFCKRPSSMKNDKIITLPCKNLPYINNVKTVLGHKIIYHNTFKKVFFRVIINEKCYLSY